MQVNSAMNSGLLGYQRATEQIDNTAQNIAIETTNSAPNKPLQVNTTESKPDTAANTYASPNTYVHPNSNIELQKVNTAMYNGMASVNVVRAADELMGTSIDVSV